MEIILSINIGAMIILAPTVDVIPCKDGYQIMIEYGDNNYKEYFICDSNAKDKITSDSKQDTDAIINNSSAFP